ncbi:MAG: hypothetical protein E7K47_13230 [Acidovorax sp.]|nr:hypothetical protein [Acidovorax sp.]
MQSTLNTPDGPAVQVPVMVAAELQDSLLMAMHDLHRLEELLNHATENLLARFGEANASLTDELIGASAELVDLRTALRSAARAARSSGEEPTTLSVSRPLASPKHPSRLSVAWLSNPSRRCRSCMTTSRESCSSAATMTGT